GTTVESIIWNKFVSLPIPLPPLVEQKRIVARIEELFKIADSLDEAAEGLEVAAKRLDKKILDLAIRGKLVPQDPNDEPASELLKRIAATSHKSPCKNQDAPIDPPFEIPEGWKWVRLGDVSDIVRGTGIRRNETVESGVQCVRYGEVYTEYGYSFSQSVSHVPKEVADNCREAMFGDVLCTLTGENEIEIAKATAYLGKERLVVGGDLAKVTNHPYDPMLLVYFLFSPFMISQKAAVCTGGMIVHMGKSALGNLLIPLPPLEEQKRIVAKVEELLGVVRGLRTTGATP
ncbi:MAG: restriction endonuclease subunit S, partial [Victivallales bacterium]|nr:restriction endonuclease subunit S [Victivallales bacterium]